MQSKMYLVKPLVDEDNDQPRCCETIVGDLFDALCWTLGEPMDQTGQAVPSPVEFKIHLDRPLPDFPLVDCGQFLASKRLADLVAENSSAVEIFQTIIRFKDRIVADDYLSINFTHSEKALDWYNSKFEIDEDFPDTIAHPKSIFIRDDFHSDDHIFRLYESPTMVICDEHFREKVVEMGITGIDFWDLSDGRIF